MVIVKLKPWSERKDANQEVSMVIKELFKRSAAVKDAKVLYFARPTIVGFGFTSGFEFQLQDQKGGTIQELSEVNNKFIADLNSRPEIKICCNFFLAKLSSIQYRFECSCYQKSGLLVTDVLGTMQGYYGGVYASNFNKFGKQFRVIYQADPSFRADPESLNKIMVRNNKGQMAPISQFITLKKSLDHKL